MTVDDPATLLRPLPEDALQECIVSPCVNRSGIAEARTM